MRKLFELGGVIAAAVLIALGITTIVMGFSGRNTVNSSLKQEYIVGAPDMTPAAIATEAKQAKLPASIALPTCNVAGKAIDSGSEARCFAQYMRIHTLEATGGFTYAQMGRFQAKPDAPAAQLAKGGGTDNPDFAAVDPKTTQPVSNPARNIWVTETALTTALNASYMADRISLFGLLVGITLLLTGLGFGILAVGGALRSEERPLDVFRRPFKSPKKTPVPTT
jgi:F0F1-type ATP synthase membrane subunit c/vacuolar-type H+-ATPase subunit K